MAKKIWVLEPDQLESETPRRSVPKVVARYLLRKAFAIPIPLRKDLIRMVRIRARPALEDTLPCYIDGPIGVGNLIPFSKPPQNPLQEPDKLHYEIPAVCDHRMRWLAHFMAQVPKTFPAG